ncbi:hypothetical protein [Cryobacterium sp. AP23]
MRDQDVRNAVAFIPVTSTQMEFSDDEAVKFDRWLAKHDAEVAAQAAVIAATVPPSPTGSLFKFRRIYSDPTGYYYDDWGRAVPVEVIASTEAEARAKGFALCGNAPSGKVWKLRLDKIEACPVHTCTQDTT